MEIIDSHHHLWDLAVRPQDWTAGELFAPIRRSFLIGEYTEVAGHAGVSRSVVVQTVCVPEETPELLALAAQDNLIAGVVGWLDLTAPDVAECIAHLRDSPGGGRLVGIRHSVQTEADDSWLLRKDVLRGLAALADASLVYDLVLTRTQLRSAARAADAVPDLHFVLDHLGNPDLTGGATHEWERDLRLLAARPNTTVKLSGLVTGADWRRWTPADTRPCTDVALDAFGPGRLMFGSDWPVCTLAADFADVLDLAFDACAALSADERAAVFTGNAARVYGL